MNMILFISVALIWGAGAINVKLQLGMVDPMISIIYRFLGSALILLLWCRIKGLSLKFSLAQHGLIAVQGIFNFALPYLLFYKAQENLTSGLAAVIFSLLIIVNALNAALFLKQSLRFRMIAAALIGLVGLALLFQPELTSVRMTDQMITAVLLGLTGVIFFSLGNTIASQNRKWRLPVVQTAALGMLYATVFIGIPVALTHTPFTFDNSWCYVGSLLYLIVGSTVIGYLCYLTLLERIGSARTAFITLLAPLVAMSLSTLFEGYQWHRTGLIGFVLILLGNLIILSDKLRFRRGKPLSDPLSISN